MSFELLFKKISPRLRKIARIYKSYVISIDENDLYQEMCVHLWKNFEEEIPEGINEAYIVKGCEFQILNYLRKQKDKVYILSMETPVNEEGLRVEDLLADEKEGLDVEIDRNMVLEKLAEACTKEKEKEVFSLLLDGYTVREIGIRLGISHVMVIKHKNRIIEKMKKSGYQKGWIFT
ncbi:MAG: sigma-70 family RNA polymerase sigma factor [Candidatus Omnitrophota bacterium]